ncbi:MAG: L,D-transpeptidase [Phycisphaerae bacterium]
MHCANRLWTWTLGFAIAALTGVSARADDATIALQAALDRSGFSAGIIDAKPGRKTRIGLTAFQTARGIPASGELDARTRAALRLDDMPTLMTYTLTAADLKDVGGPVPDDWNRRAALDRLRYESLAALLGERGHCTRDLVVALNPSKRIESLVAGDSLRIPNVCIEPDSIEAAALEVDLGEKLVRAVDAQNRTLLLFHCSIAAFAEKRPRGAAEVAVVAPDPEYTFRPEMWPEVHNVSAPLQIPAGPRNPVGLCWIGLTLPGYGIHGTPNPELIGKTGSHGCIRLANWDAVRLGRAARVGMPVRFIDATP